MIATPESAPVTINGLEIPRDRIRLRNAAARPFGMHTEEILNNGWSVANAPRPLPGRLMWTGDFIAGIFYAAGPFDESWTEWDKLNASIVTLVTNEEIEAELQVKAKEMADEYKMSLEEVMECFDDLPSMAYNYGLPWHK
jgi:hypothetical protein